MTDQDPTRARRLGDAIEAYLELQAGGRDPEGSLLAEHLTLQEWLGPMLAASGEDLSDLAGQGLDLLGDFRLVRERGRGGMGVVFEAIQLSLGRRVALKVLAADRTSSPRSIERFRREASAAAKLRHPSIVQIHGVGELAGRHMIAMEFVDGPNLAERIEQLRALPLGKRRVTGGSDERSHVVQVADLVAQLADALGYAHEHGVVHRDVKPHNVLLQGDGTPKLVDFGVAKVMDEVSLSHTRELIGTPHYMSPEQAARGDSSDPRSDVFSLGVMLYELLTLTRPFDGGSTDEVLTAIRQREPIPLCSRDVRIPRELELICGRALEKLPHERYASAAALASDLRSFLRHEPISVQPPSAVTRVRKYTRRHRLKLTMMGLVVVAGATAFGLASEWRAAGIDAERIQTRSAERFAFEAVDKVLELLADHLARTPACQESEREQTREAIGRYDSYLKEAMLDPRLRVAVANASMRVGAVYRELGLGNHAKETFQRAIDLWSTMIGEDGSRDGMWLALADAQMEIMRAAQHSLDQATARPAYEASLRSREVVLKRSPQNIDAWLGQARTHTDRGRGLLSGSGALADARAALVQAGEIWERMGEHIAADPGLRLAALQTRAGLAFLAQQAGQVQVSRAAFQEVLAATYADAQASVPGSVSWQVQISECEHGLGVAYKQLGETKLAEVHLRNAVEIDDLLRKQLPGRPDLRQRFISTSGLLSGILLQRGERLEARQRLEDARDSVRAVISETLGSPRAGLQLVNLLNRIAATYFEQDTAPDEEVFVHYGEAIEVLEATRQQVGESPRLQSQYGATLANMAAAHLMRRETDRALEHIERAIVAQRSAVDSDPDRMEARAFLRSHHLLHAQVLLRLGRTVEAVSAVDQSIEWTFDARMYAPAAVVLDQCADATVEAEAAELLRVRAEAMRAKARAMADRSARGTR